ncbi:hypothetical protein [Candidatus Nitrosocosmicus arcticus]|uniref:Putative stress response protein YsnF n=1 Tax=Candidatus Nitrosocosmicus arcticus TaxID=2035267 RepID=A0A557SXV4_9ARCH|nr:hypothetical protein [Candidatus Nitrosocosmicus arcticus]TVP41440.1 putative stress response protein YsnF [Candidatus Nitrosocosmicus arcticus]
MSGNLNINWSDVIKKEARGIDDYDLGEVQEISEDYVITERGVVDKTKFVIPKTFTSHFDGHNLHFKVSEQDASKYKQ